MAQKKNHNAATIPVVRITHRMNLFIFVLFPVTFLQVPRRVTLILWVGLGTLCKRILPKRGCLLSWRRLIGLLGLLRLLAVWLLGFVLDQIFLCCATSQEQCCPKYHHANNHHNNKYWY